MSESNGNAVVLRIMTIVGPLGTLIIGIVIGVYAAQASLAEKYESKIDHGTDVFRIERQLDSINGKLDRLLENQR